MAVVYEAIQEPLNRRVAIKALKPSIAIDSQFAERFEREAHFMASLQHENILHVIDFIKDGRSMFIIMEYVDGIDLYDLLERSPRLPADVAAIIMLQLVNWYADVDGDGLGDPNDFVFACIPPDPSYVNNDDDACPLLTSPRYR